MLLYGRSLVRLTDHHLLLAPNQVVAIGKTESMCAKLHTVAASNNRDHPTRSLYYCLFAPHIYGCCSSRTSRSWWITHSTQRQLRGCNKADASFCREAFSSTGSFNAWPSDHLSNKYMISLYHQLPITYFALLVLWVCHRMR